MILLIIILLLFLFYAVLILFYNSGWKALQVFDKTNSGKKSIRFSVIVAARNEEKNIGFLLHSLTLQSYPKDFFEVIVVDDHSTDGTAAIVNNFVPNSNIKLVQLKEDGINAYKKKAIAKGIATAKNDWVICTDADCVVNENWLDTFSSFINEEKPVFVAAPVALVTALQEPVDRQSPSILYTFQTLDFLTLQGITAASVYKNIHSMCNGANLAYKKDTFYEVDGFKGIDDIASGDDMLLMHKIWKRYPQKVKYLKSKQSIVATLAAASWKDFFHQRIRWASKAKYYDDKRILAVLVLVYLFNFSFLILLALAWININYLYAFLILWVSKTIIELPFITSISRFFNRMQLVKYFFLFQPLHIAYTIVSGFLGSFGRYVWKGRTVK